MTAFWLSWYHHPEDGEFELHTPWWVSGSTLENPSRDTIVAAVRADGREAAWALVRAAYDKPPILLERRFCEPLEGEPFSERFPRAEWMEWS